MASRQQHVAAMLQQRVHGHHEKSREAADQEQHAINSPGFPYDGHEHDGKTHDDTYRQYGKRPFQGNAASQDRAGHGAQGGNTHQYGGLVQPIAQVPGTPFDHNKLQRRPRAPEQRGDRQRDLPQLVVPEDVDIALELADQLQGVGLLAGIAHRSPGYQQIGRRRQEIHDGDDQNGGLRTCLRQRLNPFVRKQQSGYARVDQHAAQNSTYDDGEHRQAFYPAIALDQ